MGNTFNVEIMPDGKIKVTSPGGFSKETHADADEFIALIKELSGGDVEVKQLKPNLGNPHAHQHGVGAGQHTH